MHVDTGYVGSTQGRPKGPYTVRDTHTPPYSLNANSGVSHPHSLTHNGHVPGSNPSLSATYTPTLQADLVPQIQGEVLGKGLENTEKAKT